MRRIVEFPLDSGGSMWVEVDEPEEGVVRAGRGPAEALERASQTFEAAIQTIKPGAEYVVQHMRRGVEAPSSIVVEFGIKLTTQAGAVIAAVSAEANFKVTATWPGGRRGTTSG
jgi:hypothetical protein